MPPTEGGVGFMEPNILGQMIPLTTQIDFMLQRTYHDLGKLAELLPQKTDLERKIEISAFLSKTKQMFVRLLALVKWTSSANKVDKCGKILSFLQNQHMIFIETANSLARMARETLVHARLPSFSLPCAVDVLTTGTYPRLPHCIKEKIIPTRVILPSEKRRVMTRLSQLIEHRIVSTDMPVNMCKPVIANGRVVFTVDCEFRVTLTLMSDSFTVPWRLLNIEILVEDFEAQDSVLLVHPQQVSFIHHIAQQRLMENEKPLQDLYTCLHYFCQSLQLEVLYYQSIKLINCKVGYYLKVDEYVAGKLLTVSYWRDPKAKTTKMAGPVYKMTISPDEKHLNKPLVLSHFPKVLGTDGTRCIKCIDSKCLSMESMLNRMIEVRSLVKIKELKRTFEAHRKKCQLSKNPNVLKVHLGHLGDFMAVSVLEIKGTFCVSLPTHLKKHKLPLQACLNGNKKDLPSLLHNLRMHALKHHYTMALRSSFLEHHTKPRNKQEVQAFGKNYILVKLFNQDLFHLIISFHERADNAVKYEVCELLAGNNGGGRMQCMLQIDPRKLCPSASSNEMSGLAVMEELSAVISFAEQTILFSQLSQQLNNCQLRNTGRSKDTINKSFQLLLFDTPSSLRAHPSVVQAFQRNTLRTVCRLIKRDRYIFCFQLNIFSWPFPTPHSEKDGCVVVLLNYEACNAKQVLSAFKEDFNKIINTYKLAIDCGLTSMNTCDLSIESYGFNKVSIFYGANKAHCTSVVYNARKDVFEMFFWTTAQATTANCHSRITHHLYRLFNYSRSLSTLCACLVSTQPLFTTILSLPYLPFIKLHDSTVSFLRQTFTMASQSENHLRLFHHSNLCILDLFTNPFASKSSDVLVQWRPKKSQVFDSDDHKIILSFMAGEMKGMMRTYTNVGQDARADGPLEFVISQVLPERNHPLVTIVGLETFQQSVQACMDALSIKKYVQNKGGAGKMDSSGLSFKLLCALKKVSIKLFSLQDASRQWDPEEIAFLERYFEFKILSQPFNQAAIDSFFSLIHLPYRILKDLLKVIKLELNPDKTSSKCLVQLVLTQPHGTNLDKALGTNAVFFNNRNVVFILHLSVDAISLMLPLCYDLQNNTIKPIEKHPSQVTPAIEAAIKRAHEFALKNNECSIFLAVREIANSLL